MSNIINSINLNGVAGVLSIPYATCATAAGTAAKVGALDSDFILESSAQVRVKFTYANTSSDPSLNIKETGAKRIDFHGVNQYWEAGSVLDFVYNGTTWDLIGCANDSGNFSIQLYNGNAGNPKPIKFITIDYSACNSESGALIKFSMLSGHGNATSYTFLQDVIIKVNYQGSVEVDNFKYYGQEVTYAEQTMQYGDIFWVNNTTNKVVEFYCLAGQYSTLYMTPYQILNNRRSAIITQHTDCNVYSTGTREWANNSNIAQLNDLDSKVNRSGDTFTGAVTFNSVDGESINYDDGIYINKNGGSTLLGSNNTNSWIGTPETALLFRGNASNPTYNGNNVALTGNITSAISDLKSNTLASKTLWVGTQAEYDVLSSHSASTLYFVTDSEGTTSGSGSGGSGSTVSFTQTQTSGTAIGTLTIDGSGTTLYAPSYSAATTSAAGLMSASDKSKLDGITASADSVSVSKSITQGVTIATLTINGTASTLIAPIRSGTSDLTAGTSALATGTIYCVYE